MFLIKMNYDGKIRTCAVGCGQREYTLCGNAFVEVELNFEGHEPVGLEFEGTLKNLSCERCREIITFCRGLK